MENTDYAEALCETDNVPTGERENMSPTIQSAQEACAILLEESDMLCILKDDIDGLAAFAFLLDKAATNPC